MYPQLATKDTAPPPIFFRWRRPGKQRSVHTTLKRLFHATCEVLHCMYILRSTALVLQLSDRFSPILQSSTARKRFVDSFTVLRTDLPSNGSVVYLTESCTHVKTKTNNEHPKTYCEGGANWAVCTDGNQSRGGGTVGPAHYTLHFVLRDTKNRVSFESASGRWSGCRRASGIGNTGAEFAGHGGIREHSNAEQQ